MNVNLKENIAQIYARKGTREASATIAGSCGAWEGAKTTLFTPMPQ